MACLIGLKKIDPASKTAECAVLGTPVMGRGRRRVKSFYSRKQSGNFIPVTA
jgi:hypothetical protein